MTRKKLSKTKLRRKRLKKLQRQNEIQSKNKRS